MSLITLERSHPDFQRHLRGRLADGMRAVPEATLNPHTDRESVTFRLIPVKDLDRPSLLTVWIKALRLQSLPRAFVPALMVFAGGARAGGLDPDVTWLVLLGLFFLHTALVLRNDILDHLSGADRVRPDRGSRALQKGWLTVDQMELASSLAVVGAIFCALPLIWLFPAVLGVAVVTAIIAGIGFFHKRLSFKDLWAGEVSLFLLSGPLLVWGALSATGGALDERSLTWSCLWGLWVLLPTHALNFESMVADRKSGRHSLVALWGFDRSMRILPMWLLVCLVAQTAWIFLFADLLVLWAGHAVVCGLSAVLIREMRNLRSPAGSGVARIRYLTETVFAVNALIWVLALLAEFLFAGMTT